MLTKKQKNLLLFINKKLRSSGVSPSYEEMKQSLNLKSKSGIHRLISALEERGFIKRLAHKARALEVINLPETASANDIYNSFSPSVIKGGLDEVKSQDNELEIPDDLNFLLINNSKFFCFLVSIRTNIVQNLFYKSSLQFTIEKKTNKIEDYLTKELKK